MTYRVIYEPKGRAKEYAELACNFATGCAHGCVYCYAPAVLRKTRAEFAKVVRKVKLIDNLAHDAEEMRRTGDKRRVLCCFACDPYSPGLEGTMFQVLDIFRMAETRFSVLTKAGLRAVPDLGWYGKRGEFGQTIITMREQTRANMEPCASTIADRFEAFRIARSYGIPTWASVEPVIDIEDGKEVMRSLDGQVDTIKVGRWNHDARARGMDWVGFADWVAVFSLGARSKIVLKRDLAVLAGRKRKAVTDAD